MPTTAATAAGPPPDGAIIAPVPPRLHRLRRGRLLGGVAAGLGAHLGVSVAAVRVAFVLLVALNGLGALLYAVFWAVLPREEVLPGADTSPRRGRLAYLGLFALLALAALAVRGLIDSPAPGPAAFGWLIALIVVGAGIIWHQAAGWSLRRDGREAGPGAGREPGPATGAAPAAGGAGGSWLSAVLTETGRRAYLLRLVGGGMLIVVGTMGLAAAFAPGDVSVGTTINGLLFALLALSGVGLVGAPLLWRVFGALRDEREARIREQERAEFAAMVHDQVLHTLALIQRSSATGSTAHRLARAQERTLRNWLYRPTGSPDERLGAALEEAAGEVEDAYGLTVEVVLVGDTVADDRCRALVAAAREALVNAARHAQVATVSVYAEVEPGQASVFVRDRGVGFDLATVEAGRHGVRGSIIGRMERHGGRAEIISTQGEGTEVRLILPLSGDRVAATEGTDRDD